MKLRVKKTRRLETSSDSETIEAFVDKLHEDGVVAGRAEADSIVASAHAEARAVVRKAKEDAAKIVAKAESAAEQTAMRQKTELSFAARDVILRLQDNIVKILLAHLQRSVSARLADADYLGNLIRDVALEYARRDRGGERMFSIGLKGEHAAKISEFVIASLKNTGLFDKNGTVVIGNHLDTTGFVYRVDEANVEVTPEAVASLLEEYVTDQVKEIVASALGEAAGNDASN